jgi:hypothetical protein
VNDLLHHERRAEALNSREHGQFLVVQALVGRQVGADDAQEIVRIAEKPLACTTCGMSATAVSKAEIVSRSSCRMVTKTSASNLRPMTSASTTAR